MSVLDYSNPPINEVVIGVHFARLTNLLVPHVGLFWNGIRKEFPACETAPPLVGADQQPWTDPTGAMLPRVWLVSQDETEVIQLQNDRLLFNWRVRSSNKYPRFPAIKRRFLWVYEQWTRFVTSELRSTLVPQLAELSYINVIDKDNGWTSWPELGRLLPDFEWRRSGGRYLQPPMAGVINLVLPIANSDGRLTVRVGLANRISDGAEVLRFELQTVKPLTPESAVEVSEWFDRARECIVRGFSDLTDEDVQTEIWGREHSSA